MEETEKDFVKIIELISQHTGIIPRNSHITGIKNYVDKRIHELHTQNGETMSLDSYYKYLLLNSDEMGSLINTATVNETYFFREEAQFSLLQSKILPELIAKKSAEDKSLKIWSAACSSGPEIISLYLLAKAMGIKTQCTASDINTQCLDTAKQGHYKKNAIRMLDGSKFHSLLEPYKKTTGDFTITKDIINQIDFKQINLFKAKDFPQQQDIIFMRNVFIYFNTETKKQILNTIAQEALSLDGYLFVSMNEVASIESSIIPPNLEKLVDGKVFYFHKKC